jgi:DNA-binding NarL/FixJ family response regulator
MEQQQGTRIRMLIADEQSLFRESVRRVFESQPDFVVVAEAQDGLRAVTEATRAQPDVAMLDANLPNCDGIRATRLIRERVPGCRVLVLGEEDHGLLIDALEAGASGYLTKTSPLAELIEATRSVHRDQTLVPPHMLGGLVEGLLHRRRRQDEAFRRLSRLTRREREVVALLAEGADNDAIAQALIISPETARTHIQRILAKLGVHSRLAAAAFVVQNGMLDDLVDARR